MTAQRFVRVILLTFYSLDVSSRGSGDGEGSHRRSEGYASNSTVIDSANARCPRSCRAGMTDALEVRWFALDQFSASSFADKLSITCRYFASHSHDAWSSFDLETFERVVIEIHLMRRR